MIVRPALSDCIRMAAISVGVATIALLFPFALGIVLTGIPLAGILKLLGILAAIFATVSLVAGCVMYWLFARDAWSLDSQGVSGLDKSRTKRRIGWGQIDAVVLGEAESDPPDVTRLVIQARSSRTEIVARVVGTKLPEIFGKVMKHAGPEHPLANWFRPGALENVRRELIALPTAGSRTVVIAIWVLVLGWALGFQFWLLPISQALESMPDCEAANWMRLITVWMLSPFALAGLALAIRAILTYRSRRVPHPGAVLFFPTRIARGRKAVLKAAGMAGLAVLFIGLVIAAWHYLEFDEIFFLCL